MDRLPWTLGTIALVIAMATAGCAAPASAPAVTAAPSSAAPTPASVPPASSSTPGPTGTPTAAPTPPQPTAVPTATSALPAFACGTSVSQPGSVPTALMSGMAVENGSDSGRITFAFRPDGNVAATPDVTVRPASPPFTRDPSGLPMTVAGSAFLVIVLQGGTALDPDFQPTFGGPFDVKPDGSPIVEVQRAGDFEAVSTFVVGLDGPPCVRILPPDGTGRVVIEVRTQ